MNAQKQLKNSIGFPPPLLGMEPQRLAVLYNSKDLLILDKPPGLIADAQPWYPETPCILPSIEYQLKAQKPELQPFEIKELRSLFHYDAEIHGATVFSKHKEAEAHFRNLWGSGNWKISFCFLCRAQVEHRDPFTCELPIAAHSEKPYALISHSTGKRAKTAFQCLERNDAFELWEATCSYYRMHQIRLHAAESGLYMIGDRQYSREPLIFLSKLKKDYRPKRGRKEEPLYKWPAVWMSALHLEDPAHKLDLAFEQPKKIRLLHKKFFPEKA